MFSPTSTRLDRAPIGGRAEARRLQPDVLVRSFLALGLLAASLGLGAGTLSGCSAPPTSDETNDSASAVSTAGFDRNDVLSDTALRDTRAMSAREVQAFLEKTPFRNRSGLADYEEGGKSAATIFHEAATRHGINPLALLVRAHMEQGLVSETSPPPTKIAKTFGCGCADGSACATKYSGLARQAECAAGTLRRALDAASAGRETVGGWAKGKTETSLDGLAVTPRNAATAALYNYTPWVGQRGGGKAGVGGASLHFVLWKRFADFVGYEAPTVVPDDGPGTDEETNGDPGAPGTGAPGTGAPSTGAPGSGSAPAGPPADGSEDAELTSRESGSSMAEVPPPVSRGRSKSDDEPLDERPYATACSAAPHGGSPVPHGVPATAGLAATAGAVVLARRRARRVTPS